jgi:hypothetical protein
MHDAAVAFDAAAEALEVARAAFAGGDQARLLALHFVSAFGASFPGLVCVACCAMASAAQKTVSAEAMANTPSCDTLYLTCLLSFSSAIRRILVAAMAKPVR